MCSAHLYAGLLSEANRSSNPSYANLATAIFLVTVKAYITVIDKWWTDGYLDDWRNEFVVKKFAIHCSHFLQFTNIDNFELTVRMNKIHR